jgi:hypothetical protein
MLRCLREFPLFYFLTIVFLNSMCPFNDSLSLWIIREATDMNNVPLFTKLFKSMTYICRSIVYFKFGGHSQHYKEL